jgi:hypothetical protein
MDVELKRKISSLDLAIGAARKRQSPRTGLIHLFHADTSASDTIPLYENFCFALALCRMKKGETVLEAKDLMMRLFAFQTEEGNFPIYLHDFPRCYDPCQGLKIAPALLLVLREFGSVMGSDWKEQLENSLRKIILFSSSRKLSPIWQHRLEAIQGKTPSFVPEISGPAEEWEYLVSTQFISAPRCALFHPTLCTYVFTDMQEGFEPAAGGLEWAAADHFPGRLQKDNPLQIRSVLLEKVEIDPLQTELEGWHVVSSETHHYVAAKSAGPESQFPYALKLLWNGNPLHSLVMPVGQTKIGTTDGIEFRIELPKEFQLDRTDLVECALYCAALPNTAIFIDGLKGTTFQLGQEIQIQTPDRNISMRFELEDGEGQFCGHILRGNRPTQTANTGPFLYETFDWKIALRTLRRSSPCVLKLTLS